MKKLVIILVTASLIACQTEQKQNNDKEEIPILESGSEQPMPDEWIDKDTGHRIVRLGRKEGPNKSFYFHNNPFVPSNGDGDKMVYYGMVDTLYQLFVLNLETGESEQLTDHPGSIRNEIVSPVRREAFYQSNDSVYSVNVDTRENNLVYVFPEDFKARITTINASGKLLAGSRADPVKDSIYRAHPDKSSYFNRIFDAKIPHTLFTVNIETGELSKFYSERAWLNHIQFSPTDPDLLMYCHEGPWHKLDRIWTVDVTDPHVKLMHKREMDMEIAGHEFFSPDGKTIWYDLQRPKSVKFALAGVNVASGEKTIYKLQPDQWSIHFNISPDQKTFAGDGGDSTQVAHAKNGRWIYHFTPDGDTLLSEKLVRMKTHNYRPLEPNVHFSPDGKWIIFRSDMDGETAIYAAEIKKYEDQ